MSVKYLRILNSSVKHREQEPRTDRGHLCSEQLYLESIAGRHSTAVGKTDIQESVVCICL
jgi:hypothetical protein